MVAVMDVFKFPYSYHWMILNRNWEEWKRRLKEHLHRSELRLEGGKISLLWGKKWKNKDKYIVVSVVE